MYTLRIEVKWRFEHLHAKKDKRNACIPKNNPHEIIRPEKPAGLDSLSLSFIYVTVKT